MKIHHSLALFLTLLCLVVVLALPVPKVQGAGSIIRVSPTGNTSGSCGSDWMNDTCDLQYALTTVAQTGDELWVKEGTYYPSTDGDRMDTFQLRSGVALYGGFAGTETAREQRDWEENETILSGDIGNTGDSSDNSYHVVTGSGTDETAILDGFTITGGNADDATVTNQEGMWGGGMLNSNGSPTLRNLVIRENLAGVGGGIYNENSSPTLTNVTFSSNSETALYNYNSSPKLTDVTFTGNTTIWSGGAMYNFLSSPKLKNVIFDHNSSKNDGGGMCNTGDSYPTLENVDFIANTAIFQGGGVSNYNGSVTNMTSVNFTANSADEGGGMYNDNGSILFIEKAIFSENNARRGGGMYNNNSSLWVTDVTFSENTAEDFGGGMYNIGADDGNSDSSPELNNVTFSGNTAVAGGGMANNNNASPTLTNVTFTSNTANIGGALVNQSNSNPTLTNVTISGNEAKGLEWSTGGAMVSVNSVSTIKNSILWGNTAPDGKQITIQNSDRSTITDSVIEGGCTDEDFICANVTDADPRLGPLGNYGGHTPTIPLLPGSSAINFGRDKDCPDTDQRGVARPQGPHCDVGAFEYIEETPDSFSVFLPLVAR